MSPLGDVDDCFSRKTIALGRLGSLKDRQLRRGESGCVAAAPEGLHWDQRRPQGGLCPEGGAHHCVGPADRFGSRQSESGGLGSFHRMALEDPSVVANV